MDTPESNPPKTPMTRLSVVPPAPLPASPASVNLPPSMRRLGMWMAEGNWPDDVPKDAGALNAIKSAIRVLEKQMVPARADEVAREVAKMRIHYHAPKWTEAHVDQIVEDWIVTLEGYPAALISWAFAEHRAGPECSFPPLPGHIIGHMKDPMNDRRKIMRGLKAAHERLSAALDTSRQIAGPTQAEQDAAREAGWDRVASLVNRLAGTLRAGGGDTV